MKSIVARDHDKISSKDRLAPNPLWVITIGMGVFFAVVGALVAAG